MEKGDSMTKDKDLTEQCSGPCSPDSGCDGCVEYWDRMRSEGFCVDGKGWTGKAGKEWLKWH